MSSRLHRSVQVLAPILAAGILLALALFGSRPRAIDEPRIVTPAGTVGHDQDAPLQSVHAARPSAQREPVRAETADLDAPPPAAARATRPIVLSGSVTDPGGHPIGNSEEAFDGVSLMTAAGERSFAGIHAGQYAFEGLAPGDVVLRCGVWGYHGPEHHVALPPDQPARREDMVLEPYWMLAVHIRTPDGEDLGSVLARENISTFGSLKVLASVDPLAEPLKPSYLLDRSDTGVSRSRSFARAGSSIDERIEIQVDPPVYVSLLLRDRVLAAQRVLERLDEIMFTIDLARVRKELSGLVLRLVDAETGIPATDAWVSLVTAQSTEQALHPDAEGWIRYADRIPGLYRIQITSKTYAMALREVELEPGRVTDLGTMRLAPGPEISGRFVDADGHGAMVEACLTPLGELGDTSPSAAWISCVLKVDAEGRFSTKKMPAGRYLLNACHPGFSQSKARDANLAWVPIAVDTREGPVENLSIVAREPIEVVLQPRSGDLADTSYRILAANGMECAAGGFDGSTPERVHLVPGAYTLRSTRKHETLREIPFVVDAASITLDVWP